MYRIINDHPDFIVISKYCGVNFHTSSETPGLVQKLRQDLGYHQLYPVHRLDTMTSGIIIFAKNKESVRELAAQFREHCIDKFYIALGGTHPRKKQGTVIGDMKKGRNGEWILSRSITNPAITQFYSSGLGNGFRLYILRLLTGRTHQIRVALKSLSVPVLGDLLYSKITAENPAIDRGYLHSYAIGFRLKGRCYRYTDIPDYGIHFSSEAFKNVLKKYEDPWLLPWPRYPLNVKNGI
ncbi:MAG TPA: pseudouridine synthase [Chitinispirillaceae bacterium]|nr:pseudouridine synthase [Chitinispirillaceae bacterium]